MSWISEDGTYNDSVETDIEIDLNDPEIVEYVLNKAGVTKENPLSALLWYLDYGIITKDDFIDSIRNKQFSLKPSDEETASLFKEA